MEGNYNRVYVDFNDLSKTEFWAPGDDLEEIPNIRLKPRKGKHRFGTLQLLLKQKSFDALLAQEISCWEDLKWRPIQSYAQYTWGPWFSHMGKAFGTMAKMFYPLGDGCASITEVQKKVNRHNRRHAGTRGQTMMTADIDNYHGNLDQEDIIRDVSEAVEKSGRHGYHYA